MITVVIASSYAPRVELPVLGILSHIQQVGCLHVPDQSVIKPQNNDAQQKKTFNDGERTF